MLGYRPFRNSDPPALAEIWRSCGGQTGLRQPLSVDLFDQFVLSKLHFDPAGLRIALDGDRPVGFAHAGFGPTDDGMALCRDLGTTCLVVVRPDCDEAPVAAGLLAECEQYLKATGAKVLYGGAVGTLSPFYYGLYGGSDLPGILATDRVAREAFESSGYTAIDRTLLLEGDLRHFDPPMGRQRLQIRRQVLVHTVEDPPWRNWWEACTQGGFERTRFELRPQRGTGCLGYAVVRNMDPTTSLGGSQSAGLVELEIDREHWKQGYATFLLTDVFYYLMRMGVDRVEVQTMKHNTAAVRLYEKLGFKQVNEGIVYRKDGPGSGRG